jgi:hypothetical protein
MGAEGGSMTYRIYQGPKHDIVLKKLLTITKRQKLTICKIEEIEAPTFKVYGLGYNNDSIPMTVIEFK